MPLNCTVPCMSLWKDSIKRCNLVARSNLGQDYKEAFSADMIERLDEIEKSEVQGQVLFSALILELVEGEHHVYH